MNKLPIINKNDEAQTAQILSRYYENDLIPPEKKNYVTNLEKSAGPYLAIEGSGGETKYLMDAASQIATLGLGFSPNTFMGSSHLLESWTNNSETQNFKELRDAFTNFLSRKSGIKNLNLTICNSGAEANEAALGYCYQNRKNKDAKRVIAFEGSFHGRMMITLGATWNKVKREPFEWPGYEAQYCSYPALTHSNTQQEAPKDWATTWDQAPKKNFETPSSWSNDPEIALEVKSLIEVREALESKESYAILIEPMQCEGGDRYATGRFYSALTIMARSYGVPIIQDEVQTGFHLGREFFWHRQLKLTGVNQEELFADFIVCAKKSQVGLVLSPHHNFEKINEQFQVASVLRGYLHGMQLDQSQSLIHSIEQSVKERLDKLVSDYSDHIMNPRQSGLAFSFDFKVPEQMGKFIASRFDHGLLYYPAGAFTLRFRMNTSYTSQDIDFLFEQLRIQSENIFKGNDKTLPTYVETPTRHTQNNYEWHKLLLKLKLKGLTQKRISKAEILESFTKLHPVLSKSKLTIIDKTNFKDFKQRIISLEEEVYEPARITEIEKFEKAASHDKGVCLAITNGETLEGITFAAPLDLFPLERGVRSDNFFGDENTLYMLDCTVSPKSKGRGHGKFLKYALMALASEKGIKRVHGRNRDRLAAKMMEINLSLGATEQKWINEDYPDFENRRDVFYYQTQTSWSDSQISLSDAINSPLSALGITPDHLEKQIPAIVNKVCLSNFVSTRFLDQVKKVMELLPSHIQHGYTTSGQSECVDKLAKTIWFNQEKKTNRMLSFHGHYFGHGSMLSRSLDSTKDQFFDVDFVDNPTKDNQKEVLSQLEDSLKANDYLALWIEPILQKTLQRVPLSFLKDLRALATKYNTPLIFNETASSAHRYQQESFFASSNLEITPDAGMCFIGGQAGICFLNNEHFIKKPLMLISTWDGDEFSMGNFSLVASKINADKKAYLELREAFNTKLVNELEKYTITQTNLENGVGYFKGNIPNSLARYFSYNSNENSYLVNPSYFEMSRFLKKEL